jgi:CRISPR-associated protein Cas2
MAAKKRITGNNDSQPGSGAEGTPGRKMFIVVCYDITDDKRRSRLYRRLKKFGIGVQYSIYECLLTRGRILEMKKMVKATVKKEAGDRIRYYSLCESCRKRIEASDGVADQDAPVIYA